MMINDFLVGGFNLPLWKIYEWVTVGMMKFPIWMESHNPVMFQTTKQIHIVIPIV